MKILYLEDNTHDADLTKRRLGRCNPPIEVEVAHTLAEARISLQQPAEYDLVLSDFRLPDGTGLSLLSEIRDKKLPMAVVILTGLGDEELALAAIKGGADDYLAKREGYLEKLPEILEGALARFQTVSSDRDIVRVIYIEHNANDVDLTKRHLARYAPQIKLEIVFGLSDVLNRFPGIPDGEMPCDVLLIDYHLPGLNALEVIKILRHERNLDIPIVLVTGQGNDELAVNALRMGASDYLVKRPDYLYELPATIMNAYHNSRLKKGQAVLAESEEKYRKMFDTSPLMIFLIRNQRFIYANSNAAKKLGFDSPQDLIGVESIKFISQDFFDLIRKRVENTLNGVSNPILDMKMTKTNGQQFDVEAASAPLLLHDGSATMVMALDITERKQGEEALRKSEKSLRLENEINEIFLFSTEDKLFKRILSLTMRELDSQIGFFGKVNHSGEMELATFTQGLDETRQPLEAQNPVFPPQMWGGLWGKAIEEKRTKFLNKGLTPPKDHKQISRAISTPIIQQNQLLGVITIANRDHDYTQEDAVQIELIANHIAPILSAKLSRDFEERERIKAEEKLRQRLSELEVLHSVSTELRNAQTINEAFPVLIDHCLQAIDTDTGCIWFFKSEDNLLHREVARGWMAKLKEDAILPGVGIAGTVFANGTNHISDEFINDPLTYVTPQDVIPKGWGGICVPIRTSARTIGVIFICMKKPRQFSDEQVRLIESISLMAANAIHRMDLYEMTTRHVQRLQGLHEIDSAIAADVELPVTLTILLEKTVELLKADAADILLYDQGSQTLQAGAFQGIHSSFQKLKSVPINKIYAGRAILENKVMYLDTMPDEKDTQLKQLWVKEKFKEQYCVPLVAKNKVKGVLEIFRRTASVPDPEWITFLKMLANEAAIALDNAELFNQNLRAAKELMEAYDATIESWSKFIDLRDNNLEGHSNRVTLLTVKLARKMGVDEDAIIHIRRGALLHDIGKMAVPDSILNKPGLLTEEEWRIMRKHPVSAYEMLAPIAYLRPALEIPYCHHERFDGSGYPRGLKGSEIPLAASIFSVIDVWDALTSDRLYRPAWKNLEAVEYIQEQSGKQFHPDVVKAFLELKDIWNEENS
jgi:PAS domain S-box-containing protein/putative nucleotidyltransferase with HDIG domain